LKASNDIETIILVGTREQRALAFPGYEVQRVTLATGDYSATIGDRVVRWWLSNENRYPTFWAASAGSVKVRA
jgi:hypothetical protein